MEVTLYYDGECPFCNRYAEILKLKKCANLSVVDARVDVNWKEYAEDIKLDDGIIIRVGSSYFQGVQAVDMLLNICNFKGFFSLYRILFLQTTLLET